MSSGSIAAGSALATAIFDAAVAGAAPGPAVAAAVAALPLAAKDRVWIFAIGKAAHAMAAGAVDGLRQAKVGLTGGLVIGLDDAAAPDARLEAMRGDHPVPGPASFAAAQRLAERAAGMRGADGVIVLLSGGASSLVAAPVKGVSEADLVQLFTLLHARGLPIAGMNAIRKRFARWGGGRLAVAVAPASTWCLAISDVVSDDLAAIGSGPCVPDPTTAADVRGMLEDAGLLAHLPASMRTVLDQTPRGLYAETAKPGHPAFAHVSSRVLLTNRDAVEAAAAHARQAGAEVVIAAERLEGEAATRGAEMAEHLIRCRRELADGRRACVLWGGEATVTLAIPAIERDRRGRPLAPPPAELPPGGRCQELALAAARVLAAAGDDAAGITLLAAGTDGRDGTTDAAGALVDGTTWDAIARSGHDPARSLAAHDAHAALSAAGALLRRGATGTNVMDIVVGIVER